jgi:hypothetical protein
VKLQFVDANKNELEAHLAELSCRLESTIFRRSMLKNCCRDQAIESLQVEVSSLQKKNNYMKQKINILFLYSKRRRIDSSME